MENINK